MNGPIGLEAVARPDLDDLDRLPVGLVHQITPSCRSAAISAGCRPSSSRKTSSVCAPIGGPGQRTAPGSSGTWGTMPGVQDLPAEERVLDLPHHAALRGTAGRPRIRPPCRPGCKECRPRSSAGPPRRRSSCLVQAPMIRSSSSTFCSRARLPMKRGSRARSGWPIRAASLREQRLGVGGDQNPLAVDGRVGVGGCRGRDARSGRLAHEAERTVFRQHALHHAEHGLGQRHVQRPPLPVAAGAVALPQAPP